MGRGKVTQPSLNTPRALITYLKPFFGEEGLDGDDRLFRGEVDEDLLPGVFCVGLREGFGEGEEAGKSERDEGLQGEGGR